MQYRKIMQILLIGLSAISIGACTHTKKNPNASGSYDDPYSHAQASGLGQDSNYGDENSRRVAANKDVFYFDFDRSTVNSSDLPAIYAKADYLLAHPNAQIILEGHTDPRGSREYNVGLGERRANAIADILRSKGVAATQIRIVSYGAQRLASTGNNETDYQLDRRAIFARIQG